MAPIRVLIVDDSVVIRRLLASVIGKDPQFEVVGVAATGRIALQKIPQCNPDVVTLDIEMPDMDGITMLHELRRTYPTLPVIMVSSLSVRGATATIDALGAGASDYITKPAGVGRIVESMEQMGRDLLPRIRALCADRLPASDDARPPTLDVAAVAAAAAALPSRGTALRRTSIDAVGVGASTGGPNALQDVFSGLSAALPVPVFVVQHMPPLFTRMLAERLGKCGPTVFHEAQDGMPARSGHAYLAPGGQHMVVQREGTGVVVRLNLEPPENSCRPAVDPLFRSLAQTYGANLLTVVLTGMGQDGLRGGQSVRERGGAILAQDEASSVVWGMPGSVARAGLADAVVPLREVAVQIERRVRDARRRAA